MCSAHGTSTSTYGNPVGWKCGERCSVRSRWRTAARSSRIQRVLGRKRSACGVGVSISTTACVLERLGVDVVALAAAGKGGSELPSKNSLAHTSTSFGTSIWTFHFGSLDCDDGTRVSARVSRGAVDSAAVRVDGGRGRTCPQPTRFDTPNTSGKAVRPLIHGLHAVNSS